jgi:hypothetical protein
LTSQRISFKFTGDVGYFGYCGDEKRILNSHHSHNFQWINNKEVGLMEGIQFVINDEGEKTAVQIDLKRYGQLWEDFYDNLIADMRENEPRESLESVRERLRQQGKLDG